MGAGVIPAFGSVFPAPWTAAACAEELATASRDRAAPGAMPCDRLVQGIGRNAGTGRVHQHPCSGHEQDRRSGAASAPCAPQKVSAAPPGAP